MCPVVCAYRAVQHNGMYVHTVRYSITVCMYVALLPVSSYTVHHAEHLMGAGEAGRAMSVASSCDWQSMRGAWKAESGWLQVGQSQACCCAVLKEVGARSVNVAKARRDRTCCPGVLRATLIFA